MANSHKREPNARTFLGGRLARLHASTIAGPLAVAATAGVVGLGVIGADVSTVGLARPARSDASSVGDAAATTGGLTGLVRHVPSLSRGSLSRTVVPVADKPSRLDLVLAPKATRRAVREAHTKLWTTETLNLWTEPGKKAEQTGEVDAGEPVVVTGREMFGRVEIVWNDTETRWVTTGYLTDQKPFALGGDCTNGTTVPSSVSENIKKVHEAVCAAFPDILVYGTLRGGGGDHPLGLAVDIMVSGDEGMQVAEFVRKYYADLGVNYVIYQQHIWSVERSGEGWRAMPDRGSTTANHYDHVHVSVY